MVFETARRIIEAVWWDGENPDHLSIDRLKHYVSQEFAVAISIQTVRVQNRAVLGFIMRFDDGRRACVYIVEHIEIVWKRLVATKEICHVPIDLPEDMSADGVDTLQRLMTRGLDDDAPENMALRSEHMAEFVALEIIYPHENRRKDLEAIQAKSTTHTEIADKYQIPVEYVQMILSPVYLDMCDKYWRLVHVERQDELAAQKALRNGANGHDANGHAEPQGEIVEEPTIQLAAEEDDTTASPTDPDEDDDTAAGQDRV